jgi:hypothetical protein
VGKDPAPKPLEKYAKRTRVRVEWVRKQLKKRPEDMPKAYFGLRVEGATGRPWGVIVIDSADPRLDQQKVDAAFQLVGTTLSMLLEGADGRMDRS